MTLAEQCIDAAASLDARAAILHASAAWGSDMDGAAMNEAAALLRQCAEALRKEGV